MKRALIGYSGFVGGYLRSELEFDGLYNSANVESIAGESFDMIVCAGAPAAKWIANREPDADKASLERLMRSLSRASCDEVVLVSTVDVYAAPSRLRESDDCHGTPNHAYGAHRLWLEDEVRARFPRAIVLRLPALFGPGLKKNVLYDLLHANCLEAINPRSSFQWYGLERLVRDMQKARENQISLVNLCTEPVSSSEIIERCFPERSVGAAPGPEAHYDLRTEHAAVFGGKDGYIESAPVVLERIERFVARANSELRMERERPQ